MVSSEQLQKHNMSGFLGFDTSNYTTSVAIYDNGKVVQEKRLLPVKEGERGIRQSDAVFHHTKAYAGLLESVLSAYSGEIKAVGASITPTTQEGSYMPCFLVGESTARAIALTNNIPFYAFSHQQGHIAAAVLSAKKTRLLNREFFCFHVSGGTTDLVLCSPDADKIFKTQLFSHSLDLKAGQAIDRIGAKMGYPFPAGEYVDKIAKESTAEYSRKIKLFEGNCSLSGLENKCNKMLDDGEAPCDVAKFLLTYIADTITEMVEYAFKNYRELPIVFAGGVMSSEVIRGILESRFNCYFAKHDLSKDNAVGIAYLTSVSYKRQNRKK